jgi:glycosyltransferase involved in cell wall biosynthesis
LLLGDGVLGIIGWFAKLFFKKPVICVVHGLDLTYKMSLYQKLWVGFFIKKLDKLIAVGNETIKIGVEKNIPLEKFVFIPNGVDTEKNLGDYSRQDLEKAIGENLENKKLLLTSGRLVKRKGVAWFIENVMPVLPNDIIYLVSGDGPDRKNIEKAVSNKNLSDQVKVLGYVPDETRNILFNTCDIFIQPNIPVPGDIEGFGISVIEAASCRRPVIAANLEGLKDAVKNGQNGFLVKPYAIMDYVSKIEELLENDTERRQFGAKARQFVIEDYSWEKIAKKYLEEIEKTLK